ncbi:uncharacterized protein PHACADRAFT_109167 [Phanerochaete carnosa HHB-10118-sp]|uniref:Uncharacterized protein n=1 Tax=Phanerochaete carnosa (strain HHB-10118-sp) TaxID=650164 RepID=K5VB75_PHACS|nr:uncharacterized protein PHACADRAFT_109167 [Phanerochaete carnosa HHB-10118-sp]EKM48298.1 hypothetical protein PHACADRAFT_109167 [Phanerochaete carnosa HHB-10118-sp]
MFLLDTIDNLPRCPVSNSLMQVFLWTLKETGARDVPSLYKLRHTQEKLRQKCGVPSIQCQSELGNVFYMNDIRSIIAKDWANPQTRPHIHVYPEVPEGGIREVWHANKWRHEMDTRMLSPMYDASAGKHFYVDELAKLQDGTFVIPIRWVVVHGEVHADAFTVTIDQSVSHALRPLKQVQQLEAE